MKYGFALICPERGGHVGKTMSCLPSPSHHHFLFGGMVTIPRKMGGLGDGPLPGAKSGRRCLQVG